VPGRADKGGGANILLCYIYQTYNAEGHRSRTCRGEFAGSVFRPFRGCPLREGLPNSAWDLQLCAIAKGLYTISPSGALVSFFRMTSWWNVPEGRHWSISLSTTSESGADRSRRFVLSDSAVGQVARLPLCMCFHRHPFPSRPPPAASRTP